MLTFFTMRRYMAILAYKPLKLHRDNEPLYTKPYFKGSLMIRISAKRRNYG